MKIPRVSQIRRVWLRFIDGEREAPQVSVLLKDLELPSFWGLVLTAEGP